MERQRPSARRVGLVDSLGLCLAASEAVLGSRTACVDSNTPGEQVDPPIRPALRQGIIAVVAEQAVPSTPGA